MCMETAIEGERTRVPELYSHRSAIRGQKHIYTPGAGGVEDIVAYKSMVIDIVVDPLHPLTCSNRYGKGCKSILIRHDDLTNWVRALSYSTIITTEGQQTYEEQPKRRPSKTLNRHSAPR